MATQAPMGFTGRIGNLIHYRIGNKFYVRSAPGEVRQTKATKLRAGEFGRASRIGKAIREQLLPVIPNPKERKMQTRLVAAVFKWLQSVKGQSAERGHHPSFITGFEFRDKGRTVRQRWNTHFNVSNPSYGLVQIKIPAFVPEESFEAPDQTVSVLCKISVGSCDTEKGYAIGSASTELVFAYNSTTVPAQTISLKMPTPKGSLIVTGMSLGYRVSKDRYTGENTNKGFMPGGVVSAIYV